MGTYHEPRVPQGAPSDGERDVWFEDGEIKFGHYVSATGEWVIDRSIGAVEDSGIVDYGTDYMAAEDWKYFADAPYTHPGNWPAEGVGHLQSPWANGNQLNRLRYRKLTGGLIEIGGEAERSGTEVDGLCELPAGYGPAGSGSTGVTPTIQTWNGTSWVDGEVYVESDGLTGGAITTGGPLKIKFCGFTFTV